VGCLGLFECVTPPDGAEALLRAAVARLTAEGVDQVLGPLEGDTWHRYRLNVGPFGDPPFPMEPWNPPYYEAVWRAAGFVDAVRYVSVRISDLAAMLGVDESTIEVVAWEEVVWSDGAIGCPQPGMSYTQALVDGTRIVLDHDGTRYDYHSGGGRDPFYCANPE
jgi:hypothetical protein